MESKTIKKLAWKITTFHCILLRCDNSDWIFSFFQRGFDTRRDLKISSDDTREYFAWRTRIGFYLMIFAIMGREIKIIRGGNYGPAARKWKWKREYRINLGPRGGIIILLGLFYILFNLLRGVENVTLHGTRFLCLGPHLRTPLPPRGFHSI